MPGQPSAWPCYAEDEIAAVVDVLRSGKVNQWTGTRVKAFEDALAAAIGQPHAVAVVNGSAALEVALRSCGIGRGDEVIVTPRSFVASASSVNMVGATPIFADVEYASQLISPATIEPVISGRTKAIIPVHLHGRPCDMPGIMALAQKHRLIVVEDCAQSIGASICGRRVGSFGQAATFSFCQDKIITTGGEGGMALFADAVLWEKAWAFKDHGKSHDRAFSAAHSVGYRWLHESFGTNLRMTEMQAAIGLVQLPKLDGWILARRRIAERLAKTLQRFPCVKVEPVPAADVHAFYRLEITVEEVGLREGWNRDRIVLALRNSNVHALVGPCPELYREPVYAQHLRDLRLPNAARLGRTSVVLLCHPTLDDSYLLHAETAIRAVFGEACHSSAMEIMCA